MINAKNIHHGIFVFATNAAEIVQPSVNKRTIVFTIENQLTEDEAVKRDAALAQLQNKMSNALYRRFLGRMLEEIDEYVDYMKIDDSKPEGWYPDIFRFGAEILLGIIQEVHETVHPAMKAFCWRDFMGELAKSKKALNLLLEIYNEYGSIFSVDHKRNFLRIDLSKLEEKAANRFVDVLKNELPVSLEPKALGPVLVLKYSVTKDYTGINFIGHKSFLYKMTSLFRGD